MSLKNVYPPEKAAQFLGVTIAELQQLVHQGDLVLRKHNENKFFLGGELDCIKPDVQERLKMS